MNNHETPTLREVHLTADAGGDVVMDVTFSDRSQSSIPSSLSVTIDRITAGDDVDLVINDSKAGNNLSDIDGITVSTYYPTVNLTTKQARSSFSSFRFRRLPKPWRSPTRQSTCRRTFACRSKLV